MKSAALFVAENLSVLFIPPTIALILCGLWAYWIAVFVYLAASGEITNRSDSPFPDVTLSDRT